MFHHDVCKLNRLIRFVVWPTVYCVILFDFRSVGVCHLNLALQYKAASLGNCVMPWFHVPLLDAIRCNNCRLSNMLESLQLLHRVAFSNSVIAHETTT